MSRFSPRLRADLLLLLVAAVWGSGFVAQRLGADAMSAFYFNAARFLLGALVLLALVRFRWRLERRHWKAAALAGTLLFAASWLQQAGIESTTIGNASFITGLYVVAVPLELFLLFRQRTGPVTWAAVGLATLGVGLLALQDSLSLRPGDTLELLGAFMWAAHVILIGRMARRVDGYAFAIAQFLVCSAFNWLAGLALDAPGMARILPAFPAVLYSAIFPIALGFTLQIFGQRQAPPSDAAILLSLETVFGALFGVLFFAEAFTLRQVLGAMLILAAILLCQVRAISGRPGEPSPISDK